MTRLLVFFYGLFSYALGVIGLVCLIAVLAHLFPWGFLTDMRLNFELGVAWNFLLVFLWGLIHSVMARPRFKEALIKIIPEPAERSTYVLVAGITTIAMVGYWQNLDGYVWQFGSGTLASILWAGFIFGWIFLLAATFAINHFDLFGLRQVFFHLRNLDRPPLEFVKRAMYAYIRHPIQTGVLLGVWLTPVMSNTQLVLSIGFTFYIFIGLWFEERDLVAAHGDEYLRYKAETGKVFPKF